MKKVEKNHKSIKEQSNETYKNQGSKITKTQNNKKINNSLYMKPHGVTLVSLVVTIIVLIILAGISLNLTIGENGLFTMAKKAKENTELAQIEEQTRMNELYTQIEQETYYDTPAIGETQSTIDELSKTIEELKSQLQGQINELDEKMKNVKLEAYPVGSIYISTDATNPASKFGGTWESYGEGKTLLSSSGTSGQTGGSNKVTLSTANLPSHTHTYQKANSTTEAHVLTVAEIPKSIPRFYHETNESAWAYGIWSQFNIPGSDWWTVVSAGSSDEGHTHSISTTTTDTSAVGNGTEFSVQNEYITVHVWKRTE